MPKLIDADKLKEHYAWWDNEDKKIFDTIIDLQPEAVVRCKDCKHRPIYDDWGDIVPQYSELKTNNYGETFYRNDYTCPFVSSDCVLSHMPKDDDFCSKGERK